MIDDAMPASLSERLARHRARRRQGQPTVSAWRPPWPFDPDDAATMLGAPVVTSSAETLEEASRDWLVQWLAHGRLQATVSERLNRHLAEALRISEKRAQKLLTETGIQDRSLVLDQAAPRLPSARLERLLRWWVQHPRRGGLDGIAALDGALSDIDTRTDLRALTSMAELCPPEDRPWLVAVPRDEEPPDPVSWLESRSRQLETVARALPDWPVLVAAPDPVWRACLLAVSALPASVVRLQAALLEPLESSRERPGEVVPFYDLSTSLRSLLRGQGSDAPDLTDDLRVPDAPPAAAPLADRSHAAAPVADGAPAVDVRAGLAALLTRLEADPTSAGQFVVDARLDGGPAGRKVEVPLYAAELALAIEVDERYAPSNLEAYRRDRAKDLWLQRRGVMVVRLLAEDLEQRLDAVLHLMREVVRERRIRGRRR